MSTARPKVFVTRLIPELGLNKIREFCDADIWTEPLPPSRDVLLQKVADCQGLLSLLTERIDAELMDAAPKLKVVSNYAVGFNNIDVPEATSRGICVGNTPGVLTDATADMAFALLISAARRIVEGHQYGADNKWKTWEPLGHIGQDLVGKTIGIVGMGRIGYAMAKRCFAGWDMKIIYMDLFQNEQAEKELKANKVQFETLLEQSDFISLHANLDDSTRGLFNAAAFRKMKPTAVFVNTARGPLVVEADLISALQTGQIFAAGLDVTDPEPPAADSPLFRLPNLIVAPHIASATVSSRNGMADIASDNLIAGLSDEPLRAWVNPEVEKQRKH